MYRRGGSVVGIATVLLAGGSGVQIPVGTRDLLLSETSGPFLPWKINKYYIF
jgi:hypothetical protein